MDMSTHGSGTNGQVGVRGAGFLLYGERVERDLNESVSSSEGDLVGFPAGSLF